MASTSNPKRAPTRLTTSRKSYPARKAEISNQLREKGGGGDYQRSGVFKTIAGDKRQAGDHLKRMRGLRLLLEIRHRWVQNPIASAFHLHQKPRRVVFGNQKIHLTAGLVAQEIKPKISEPPYPSTNAHS